MYKRQILKYVEKEHVERIIVGHPKQMNNQESENMRNIVPVSYTHLDVYKRQDLDRWQAQVKASFLFRIADNLYVGPMASYDYVHGKNMERSGLLELSLIHIAAGSNECTRRTAGKERTGSGRN